MDENQDNKTKIPWHQQKNLPWYKVVLGTIGFVFYYIYDAFYFRDPFHGGLFIDMPEPWWDPNLPLGKRLIRATTPIWARLLPIFVLIALVIVFCFILLIIHYIWLTAK